MARFWMMPLYTMVGSVAGTWLFVTAPHVPYMLVLGLLTLLYLSLDRLGKTDWPLVRRHEQYFAPVAGLTAGAFEGTANVSAPALIIFYLALDLAPESLVQAMCICFLVGKATQFAVLTARGGVTLGQCLATVPFMMIGVVATFAGMRLRHRIDAPTFRRWVKRGLLVIALVLLARYAFT